MTPTGVLTMTDNQCKVFAAIVLATAGIVGFAALAGYAAEFIRGLVG